MRNPHSTMTLAVVKVFGEVLFFYGLLGWLYGVVIQVAHPNFLSGGLSHLTPWIRVDTFTIMSFLLSIVGFLVWRLAMELAKS